MLSRTKHKKDCIRHLLALHVKKPPSRIKKIKRSILSDQTSSFKMSKLDHARYSKNRKKKRKRELILDKRRNFAR